MINKLGAVVVGLISGETLTILIVLKRMIRGLQVIFLGEGNGPNFELCRGQEVLLLEPTWAGVDNEEKIDSLIQALKKVGCTVTGLLDSAGEDLWVQCLSNNGINDLETFFVFNESGTEPSALDRFMVVGNDWDEVAQHFFNSHAQLEHAFTAEVLPSERAERAQYMLDHFATNQKPNQTISAWIQAGQSSDRAVEFTDLGNRIFSYPKPSFTQSILILPLLLQMLQSREALVIVEIDQATSTAKFHGRRVDLLRTYIQLIDEIQFQDPTTVTKDQSAISHLTVAIGYMDRVIAEFRKPPEVEK